MDATAIEIIQKTAVDAARPRDLGTPMPAIFHDGNVISIEHLQQGRARYRGKYATDSIEAFATYAKAYPGGEGFVDIESMSALLFFNLGTPEKPGHGDWRAELKLRPTPEFHALKAAAGARKQQREMVEWFEDWNECVQAVDANGGLIKTAIAIGAIRSITVKATSESNHQEKDFGARRSAVEEIEASSENGIPHSIRFTAIPYPGLGERIFTLRLSVLTSGEKPQLILRPVAFEQAVEAIAKEFRSVLESQIGDAARLVLGRFAP